MQVNLGLAYVDMDGLKIVDPLILRTVRLTSWAARTDCGRVQRFSHPSPSAEVHRLAAFFYLLL